jgi:exosortase
MVGIGVWMVAGAALYAPVLAKLARDWSANATYSHGFVVLPIALFLAWQQRDRLRHAPARPSRAGLLILAFSLGLYVIGSLGAELFITRLSMIGVLAGTIVYVWGWKHFRLVSFPLAFLLFMIPLPAIVFDHVAVSLQLVASRLGEFLLQAVEVPVLRDGNILTLANVTLEVSDACSGIRSLVALLAVTTLVGYLWEPAAWRRAFVAAAAVPLAIGLNGARIALTGLAATWFGPEAASGSVHAASGWVVFVVALGCVWALQQAMRSPEIPEGRGLLEAA